MSLKVMKHGTGGPCVSLTFGSEDELTIYYQHSVRQTRVVHDNGTEHTLDIRTGYLSERTWTDVQFEYNGTGFTIQFAAWPIRINMTMASDLTAISVSNRANEDIMWDDLTISKPKATGEAVVGPIDAPEGMGWGGLQMLFEQAGGTSMIFSVLNGSTLEPIKGHENLTTWYTSLASLHPRDYPSLAFSIELSGHYQDVPEVHWCEIGLMSSLDEVFSRDRIPSVHMLEDTPVRDVFNVTRYFSARYTDSDDLTYRLTNISDPDHVRPYLDGFQLCVDLPERNWFGNANFRINCSSPEHSLEKWVWILVEPVNDPPVIEGPLEFNVTEDEPFVVDLGKHISDVDDPIEELGIIIEDHNFTVKDRELHLFFETGGFDIVTTLEVADGEVRVTEDLVIHVIEVNDAPIIDDVPDVSLLEGYAESVDLAPYIRDEDEEWTQLTLECEDPAVTAIEGLSVTLLFETPGERQVEFSVFDGIARTTGTFHVTVENANDPPVVSGLGGHPPGGTITVLEGEEVFLQVEASDEDGDDLAYHAHSDGILVEVFEDGTIAIAGRRGRIGSFQVTVTVRDPWGLEDMAVFTVEVVNVNDPPDYLRVLSPENWTSVVQGENVTFSLVASDPDMATGQVLTVTWRSDLTGVLMTLTSEDELTWTTDDLAVGTHMITVTVSDGEYERSASIHITVTKQPIEPGPPGPEQDPTGPKVPSWVMYVVAVVVAVIVLAASLLWVRRRSR
jgi:hypothetical protein